MTVYGMRLSISNLAWNKCDNDEVYAYLCRKHFDGIEIAPTKLFEEDPYSHIDEAVAYFSAVSLKYGLSVSSMQSIWYGRQGNIFESDEDRENLRDYTCAAVDFASSIKCGNLVFGNPKARNKPDGCSDSVVYGFFKQISDYADSRGTVISLEPNPEIYNTNFINKTEEAFSFCRNSGCDHLKVNVDLGTILYNKETLDSVRDNIDLVNHIHISEPYLKKIEKREIHKCLLDLDFDKYVSIEMGLQESLKDVFDVVDYIAEVFHK